MPIPTAWTITDLGAWHMHGDDWTDDIMEAAIYETISEVTTAIRAILTASPQAKPTITPIMRATA